jgi:hypothetical protein
MCVALVAFRLPPIGVFSATSRMWANRQTVSPTAENNNHQDNKLPVDQQLCNSWLPWPMPKPKPMEQEFLLANI